MPALTEDALDRLDNHIRRSASNHEFRLRIHELVTDERKRRGTGGAARSVRTDRIGSMALYRLLEELPAPELVALTEHRDETLSTEDPQLAIDVDRLRG